MQSTYIIARAQGSDVIKYNSHIGVNCVHSHIANGEKANLKQFLYASKHITKSIGSFTL